MQRGEFFFDSRSTVGGGEESSKYFVILNSPNARAGLKSTGRRGAGGGRVLSVVRNLFHAVFGRGVSC